MKNFYVLLALCLFSGINAQIINFPDANFKAKLLQHFDLDRNIDGQIDQTEAANYNYFINVSNSNIQNISGIEYFTSIKKIDCSRNQITNFIIPNSPELDYIDFSRNSLTGLSVSNLPRLVEIDCGYNPLTSISVSDLPQLLDISSWFNEQLTDFSAVNCPRLMTIECWNNPILNLNLINLPMLQDLSVWGNHLTTLDLSNFTSLVNLNSHGSPFLRSVFVKNGIRQNFTLHGCPNLTYICADESELGDLQNLVLNCTINSYCSFTPGGAYYTIQGNTKFDADANGCDTADVKCPHMKYSITNGSVTGSINTNYSGEYSIPVQAGTHTIAPVLENPAYFNVSPATLNVTFPAQTSPLTQNFCLSANGIHPDLEVSVLPNGPARPGFDATYKLIYKNKGNTTQSGTVNLTFNDAILDFVDANPTTANQSVNNLSWTFANLTPFETREITVTLNVNSPMETPAVNENDVLTYTATIASPAVDDMPGDNTFALNQMVVNSYDPNDKTCLEGTKIAPSEVGKYVHYMIRFENTGTFPAENIVVKDMIDLTKFDIASLVPMKGSHSFVTNITSGNKVEFIFENINLPFDDANNDGYVAFKIKTKPTLVNGDTFSNTASIYFDYNFPIVTNTATTTITALNNQDFEFSNYFKLYPNPVHDVLNIVTKDSIDISSISIYNTLGQLVLVVPNAQNVNAVDVAKLTSGNYFIKINSDKGTSNTKFIKQ